MLNHEQGPPWRCEHCGEFTFSIAETIEHKCAQGLFKQAVDTQPVSDRIKEVVNDLIYGDASNWDSLNEFDKDEWQSVLQELIRKSEDLNKIEAMYSHPMLRDIMQYISDNVQANKKYIKQFMILGGKLAALKPGFKGRFSDLKACEILDSGDTLDLARERFIENLVYIDGICRGRMSLVEIDFICTGLSDFVLPAIMSEINCSNPAIRFVKIHHSVDNKPEFPPARYIKESGS